MDHENGKEGKDLDEFNAHRFLEKNGETKTIKELRAELAAIDMDFNRRMALIEFLLFRFDRKVEEFVARPQGENTEEVAEAQRQLEEAQKALDAAVEGAEQAKQAAEAAAADAAAAEAAAAEAARTAQEAQEAEAAQKAAVAELEEQETAYNNKTEDLKAKSEEGGIVSRNRAKAELAQHLAEDPLPLRRAKLTAEAAAKKAEKATAAALDAANEAKRTADAAEQTRLASEAAAAEAERLVGEAERLFAEAEAFLEEAKSRPGGGQGALWWIERDLEEARKYMPRGGVAGKWKAN